MIENRPLVAALVEKDLAEQYANNPASVLDLRAIINSGGSSFRPAISNLSDEDTWKVLGIFNYSGVDDTTVTELIINQTETSEGIDLENLVSLVTLSAPNLVSITGGGYINITGASLVSISFPELISASLSNIFFIFDAPNLTTIDLSNLVTVGNFRIRNTGITSFDISKFNTGSDREISNNSNLTSIISTQDNFTDNSYNFSNNALDSSTVNSILANALAAGVTSAVINLSGGTNAAPSGQGISDKADLITAGNTVTTN